MTYIQGFLVPVTPANKESYLKMATDVAPMFEEFGARRIVECWGENVPTGKTTDMYRAVNGEVGENVVFSWIDWGSKQACDQAHEKMMQDDRMKNMPETMPFDGMRMLFAGFETLGMSGDGGKTRYVQGYVAPVPKSNRQAFADMCATMREVALDCGALHAFDGWAEDIEDGKVTDFKQAVKAKDDEAVAFGFAEWPSKQACDEGSAKMHNDERMPGEMPLDGMRLIYGGFEVMLDTKE